MADEKKQIRELTDEQANEASGGNGVIYESGGIVIPGGDGYNDGQQFACYWCGQIKEGRRYKINIFDVCEGCWKDREARLGNL